MARATSERSLHQIGEAAERTGLSIRTIRYYEEMGLVRPSGHTSGGFRLYTDADIERLLLVKATKPLDLSLETTQEMLRAWDRLASGEAEPQERERLTEVLAGYLQTATERLEKAESRLASTREALGRIRGAVRRHRGAASGG
jgi:MerR family transcriptional regulator, copper efflux regulator